MIRTSTYKNSNIFKNLFLITIISIVAIGLMLVAGTSVSTSVATQIVVDVDGLAGVAEVPTQEQMLALQNGIADVGTSLSHAVEKHGAEVVSAVRNCLDGGGSQLTMWNPITNRFGEICEFEPGRFGFRIIETIKGEFEEVTIFDDLYEHIGQAEYYMNGQGYTVLDFLFPR